MSGALFGSVGGGGRSGSKNLVEFRAGKMYLKGTTVTPDKRKGLVYIHQAEDSLIHFCWKDRTSGVVEDDLIIFPDDCEFKRVPQCTTGRVYILKFKSSSRKFFFWIQEPKTDKDEEHCKKVNDSLNNPPSPGSGLGGGQGAGGLPPELAASLGAGLGEGGLQSMLGNIDHQQLMQLLSSGGLPALSSLGAGLPGFGGSRPASSQSTTAAAPQAQTTAPTVVTTTSTAAPSTTTPATTTTTTSSTPAAATTPATTPIQLSDLQSILRTMNIPGNQPQQERVDLSQMMTSDVMTPILANPEVQQQLLQFAPEGEVLPRDPEQLRETLQSPQFQQAMGMFTAAFQSGQLGPLMSQFGLSQAATDAANQGDLEAFGQALQGGGSAATGDKKEEKKKDGDDDDDMQVD